MVMHTATSRRGAIKLFVSFGASMFAFGLAGCSDNTANNAGKVSNFNNAVDASNQVNALPTAGNMEVTPTGTPYERVLESNGGNTRLTVSEFRDFVDTRERTRYKVSGLVTRPDVLEDESKLYSATNTSTTKYITIEFDSYADKPKNDSTVEMVLYVEPRGVYRDVPYCHGSVNKPDASMSIVEVTFDELYEVCQCVDTATITVGGYISRSTLQDSKSSYTHYRVYESSSALIDEDTSKCIPVDVSSEIKVVDGSEVDVRIIHLPEVRSDDYYSAYASHVSSR